LLIVNDLFKDKVDAGIEFKAFSDYEGPLDYENVIQFIVGKCQSKIKNTNPQNVYPHVTCATDTSNIEKVWEACYEIILNRNLQLAGINVQI